jgi:hypothetical protein
MGQDTQYGNYGQMLVLKVVYKVTNHFRTPSLASITPPDW